MAEAKAVDYKIKPGDNFFLLAKNLGVSLDEVLKLNPGVTPEKLEVGQSVKLPGNPEVSGKASPKPNLKPGAGTSSYADSPTEGESFSGKNMDHIGVNIGGVGFELKRVIDNQVPHEVHILLPRTEVHTVTKSPEAVLCETQVMISNIDIIHSPRQ